MGLLFGIGLLLGLAIGPTLNAYASLEGGSTIIAQAAGATALFMGVLGTVGYMTKRDLTALGRISFFGLLALLLFGIVAIFVASRPRTSSGASAASWCSPGLTVYDFWRLRRAGNGDVALIALSIYLDAFNIFLFMLQLLGAPGS